MDTNPFTQPRSIRHSNPLHTGRIRSYIFSLIVWLPGLFSCHPHASSRADETNALIDSNAMIDSLIQIQRINESTMVVKFGADAISALHTDQGIVVIDAGISTGLTERFRKKIVHEFTGSHFPYVINTHAHPDHYGGNSVFSESAVIGHLNGLEEMDERLADPEKTFSTLGNIVDEYDRELKSAPRHSEEWIRAFTQKTRYQYAWMDVKNLIPVKKPDITFSDSLVVQVGSTTFEMKYFGQCHSNSDILVHVPEQKLLFAGDLILQYGRPSINDTTMIEKEQWIKALYWTEKRLPDIEHVISGHGQILSPDDLSSFMRIIREKANLDVGLQNN